MFGLDNNVHPRYMFGLDNNVHHRYMFGLDQQCSPSLYMYVWISQTVTGSGAFSPFRYRPRPIFNIMSQSQI